MINPRDVRTLNDARQIINERGLTHIKVGISDSDGLLLGKYMRREKFLASLEKGFSFCNVILGWDVKDQLYDNARFTGWHTGYPDALVRILPHTCRELPLEENGLFFLCEFEGKAESICSRAMLRRMIDKARSMRFEPSAAFEYEFFLFRETPQSVREKGFRNLEPFTPDNCGYSVLRNSVHADLYHQILSLAEEMDFPIESIHTETGPGVIEAAIAVDKAEAVADKAVLFKTFIKVLAQHNELMATFMARWSNDQPGQSGHIHVSLTSVKSGESVFHDAAQPYGMSEIQRHFVGGLQQLMPEFTAMLAPTVNSYSRLVPGFWAPTHATWGIENRTCALRVIPGSASSQRVEYRLGSADASPYLALAAVLASGLYGIEKGIEPVEQVRGNAYEQQYSDEFALPQTLFASAQRLKQSSVARRSFGDAFVEHFAASREWEEREFRKHITDWELERYFEII
ncbi:glutamine synthetase family protein [Spongorhabdus nitratireducens]